MKLNVVALLLFAMLPCFVVASEEPKNSLDGMTLIQFIHYVAKRLDKTVIIAPRVRGNKEVTVFSN